MPDTKADPGAQNFRRISNAQLDQYEKEFQILKQHLKKGTATMALSETECATFFDITPSLFINYVLDKQKPEDAVVQQAVQIMRVMNERNLNATETMKLGIEAFGNPYAKA